MTSAVTVAFGKASADNRAALVGYLPAGFPTVDGAIAAAQAMARAGADIIEVGPALLRPGDGRPGDRRGGPPRAG